MASLCFLCQDGSSPLFPDIAVNFPFLNRSSSCSDLEVYMQTELDPTSMECFQLQLVLADPCGCTLSTTAPCLVEREVCPLAGDGVCGNYRPDLDPYGFCLLPQTDCVDCDGCLLYNLNCTACVDNGCHWCPTDGVCSSYTTTTSKPGQESGLMLMLEGSCAVEDWTQVCTTNSSTNVFTDPLYDANRWMYDMIHIESVWAQGFTGDGIHIRINDEGVDATHPEFEGRFDVSSSCTLYGPSNITTNLHGTTCASIAAGGKNNGVCAVGIAPDATLSSCTMLGIVGDPQNQYLTVALENQHVSSNSWESQTCVRMGRERRRLQDCPFSPTALDSPCASCTGGDLDSTCIAAILYYCYEPTNFEKDTACLPFLELFASCGFNTMPEDEMADITNAIVNGRQGKGLIILFPTGNHYSEGSDTNMNGHGHTRFIISVGAVGKDGRHASYSAAGASVFLSAPGGDFEFRSNVITARAGGGCRDAGSGTSFACPIVAGVSALMLQRNPSLSWRDVQAILAATAQHVDTTDPSWVVNAASYHHSYKYGFGVVDAAAAVDMASGFVGLGPERLASSSSGDVNLQLADFPAAAVSSPLEVTDEIVVESVVVYVDLSYTTRGHLKVVLTSPSGTQSVVAPGDRPANNPILESEMWKFLSLRTWGESSRGTWTLSVSDTIGGDWSTCIDLPTPIQNDTGYSYNDTCFYLAANSSCSKPEIQEICCACGGGELVSNGVNVLRSWNILVYGHDGVTTLTSGTDSTMVLQFQFMVLVVGFWFFMS